MMTARQYRRSRIRASWHGHSAAFRDQAGGLGAAAHDRQPAVASRSLEAEAPVEPVAESVIAAVPQWPAGPCWSRSLAWISRCARAVDCRSVLRGRSSRLSASRSGTLGAPRRVDRYSGPRRGRADQRRPAATQETRTLCRPATLNCTAPSVRWSAAGYASVVMAAHVVTGSCTRASASRPARSRRSRSPAATPMRHAGYSATSAQSGRCGRESRPLRLLSLDLACDLGRCDWDG
jgi:hypothetical protein